MAENDENDLIGYDPLAWMDSEPAIADEVGGEIFAIDSFVGSISDGQSVDIADEIINESEIEPLEADGIDQNDDLDCISPVILEPSLSIQNVGKLHERLKKVFKANDVIEINAADVSSIDTTTFQLLVALKKDALNMHKTVVLESPSPRFYESAKLLGLLEVLDVKH